MLGRRKPPEVLGCIRAHGFRPLDITVVHAQRAGALPRHHLDPSDRMLCAQALVEGVPVVGVDEALDAYGVTRLW